MKNASNLLGIIMETDNLQFHPPCEVVDAVGVELQLIVAREGGGQHHTRRVGGDEHGVDFLAILVEQAERQVVVHII